MATTAETYHNEPKPIQGNTKRIHFQFRWPVEQVAGDAVVMKVPTVPNGAQLIAVTPSAIETFGLTDKEVDKVITACTETAIRTLAIVE